MQYKNNNPRYENNVHYSWTLQPVRQRPYLPSKIGEPQSEASSYHKTREFPEFIQVGCLLC
jgi:hypothetical protein